MAQILLKLARCPHSLAATPAALPSMSLIPFAPFFLLHSSLLLHLARPRRPVIGHVLIRGHARNGAADHVWERRGMKEELRVEAANGPWADSERSLGSDLNI
jgi:hypothetical protein